MKVGLPFLTTLWILNFVSISTATRVEIKTLNGDKCVPSWRTCPCSPLINSCTTENAFGRAWCATEVDPVTRVYVDWDWCEAMENCNCRTESKRSCYAFTYQNVSYPKGSCSYDDSSEGRPWCATKPGLINPQGPSGGANSNWDYCNEHCGTTTSNSDQNGGVIQATELPFAVLVPAKKQLLVAIDSESCFPTAPSGLSIYQPQGGLGVYVGGFPLYCGGVGQDPVGNLIDIGICFRFSKDSNQWISDSSFDQTISPTLNKEKIPVALLNNNQFWAGSARTGKSAIYTAGQGFSAGPPLPLPIMDNTNADASVCFTKLDSRRVFLMSTHPEGSKNAYVYDFSSRSWSIVGQRPDLPSAKVGCGSVKRSNGQVEVVAFGMFDDINPRHTNVVMIFNLEQAVWRRAKHTFPLSNYNFNHFYSFDPPFLHQDGNTLVAFSPHWTNYVYRFDLDTEWWVVIGDWKNTDNFGLDPLVAIPVPKC